MENRINHIIARVLSGESSSDDILSLSEWLNENEKNRDEFRRLKNYWDADVAFKHSVAPAFSADKLQQKINVQRRQTARRQLWRNAIPLIAAACLLFIFSTALFLYNTNDRISEHYTLLTDEHTSNFTMEDITVSGTFNQKQSIEQILKVISHSLPIRWTNKTGNYHIQHAH